jgi:hypothetical protein
MINGFRVPAVKALPKHEWKDKSTEYFESLLGYGESHELATELD